jgi:hypothetical protein
MFTPNLDDRETLGQGLRPPGALRDLRKDAGLTLGPNFETKPFSAQDLRVSVASFY